MESLPDIIGKEEDEPIDANKLKSSAQSQDGGESEENKLENDLNVDADEFWSVDGTDADEGLEIEKSNGKGAHNHFSDDMTIDQIQNSLKPELEKIVRKYCSQKVEEVVWEIIPIWRRI